MRRYLKELIAAHYYPSLLDGVLMDLLVLSVIALVIVAVVK